jgi:phosphatidylglycerol:prolipoprotein diacylglycerol transferase
VHPEVWHGPLSLIAVWEGGIVSYGGFFGGALGGMWYARRHRIPIARLGDAVLPALLLGQAFGRIGCFLVGDDYGRPWDGPWAVRFPDVEGGLIPAHLVGVPLHPAQLYLSLMNLAIFGATAWLFARRRFDGQVLAATMVLYAVGRFLVEYTRGDDVERGALGALSTAQWWSLATIVLAGLLFMRFRRRAVALP